MMTTRQYAMLALAGGVIAAVGSALPWYTVTTGFGSLSITGTQGDGKFTLVAGILVALLAFWRINVAPRWSSIAILVGSVVILGTGALSFLNLETGATPADLVGATGIGLYAVLAGGLLALIGSMTGKPAPPA